MMILRLFRLMRELEPGQLIELYAFCYACQDLTLHRGLDCESWQITFCTSCTRS